MLHAKTQHLPQKQNDNTYFQKQCYRQEYLYKSKYIYIYLCAFININIGKFFASVSLCLEKRKAGGGIGGRAQRLPPKQNDNTYSHKQSYMQKRSASPKAE